MSFWRLALLVCLGYLRSTEALDVTLSWNASSDPQVVGYRLYWGAASHNYNNMIDGGNIATASVINLVAGTTYYFAVTDYDASGIESAFSDEVVYTPPINVPMLNLAFGAGETIMLSGSGPVGYLYEVQATDTLNPDSQNWAVVGTVTVGLNSLFQFLDPGANASQSRFYRLHQIFP